MLFFGFSFRHACLFLVFFLNYLFHSPVYWEYISSTNFIFLVILFAVIIKLFFNTIEISNLEYKIKELSQKIAIDEKDFNETKENKSEEEMDE